MNTLLQDLRYALRQLRRRPAFTLATVATIAVGIGGTAAIFSMVNALLLRPLPVAEPDRLVVVQEERESANWRQDGHTGFPYARFEAFREASGEIFEGLAAHRPGGVSMRMGDEVEAVAGAQVSENYFEVLGVLPALGRFFTPAEAREPVAVLGHSLWMTRFGADPAILGRTVQLDSRDYTVIGVAQHGFGGVFFERTAVWIPVGTAAGAPPMVLVFGRLAPGVMPERASAAVATLAAQIPYDPPTPILGATVEPLRTLMGESRGLAMGLVSLLLGVSVLVLLVASANVGGMLLARGASRRREVAIRQAVGASRGRLVRQLFTEHLVTFLLGGAAGVLLAAWLSRFLESLYPPLGLDLGLDVRVVIFAFVAALATGLIFGLFPAFQGSRVGVASGLKEGAAATAARTRVRSAFVVAQFAVTVVLLVVAGLFIRTLGTALASDLGFEAEELAFGTFSLDAHGYDPETRQSFHAELLERLDARPEIAAASLARFAPVSGYISSGTAVFAGPGGDAELSAQTVEIGPRYLEAVGIPLQAGRAHTAAEAWSAEGGVVINEAFARAAWPGQNPLGRTIRIRGAEREVIGVARDSRYEQVTERQIPPFVYLPAALQQSGGVTVLVRGRSGPQATLTAVRAVLRYLDPNVALEGAMPASEMVEESLIVERFAALLIGIFGVVGLVLAAIGIAGVLFFHVGQRTREIGVRLALGARAAQVSRMVVRQGLLLVTIGGAAGFLLAVGAGRLVAGMLYGVGPADPATFAGVLLLLLAVALVSAYLPARRAARVDPMIALRAE